MRSGGHSNLDGLKLRSLGSCGGSRRRLRGSLLFRLSLAAGSKNRSRAQSNAEGQCGFKEGALVHGELFLSINFFWLIQLKEIRLL